MYAVLRGAALLSLVVMWTALSALNPAGTPFSHRSTIANLWPYLWFGLYRRCRASLPCGSRWEGRLGQYDCP